MQKNIWAYLFRVSLVISLIACGIGVFFIFIPEYSEMRRLKLKKEDIQAKNDGLERRIRDFENRQHLFRTDPRFVERLVREQFGMVRENELIYKVIHDVPELAPPQKPAENP